MPFPFFNTPDMPFINTRLAMIAKRGATLLNEELMWFEAFDQATKQDIVKWIRKRLITTGEDGNGNVIGYYSYYTDWLTNGHKKAGTPYTLFDTGDFQRSIIVLVFRDEIFIKADGNKREVNLFDKYGKDIISLNQKELNELRKRIKNRYIDIISKTLFVGA